MRRTLGALSLSSAFLCGCATRPSPVPPPHRGDQASAHAYLAPNRQARQAPVLLATAPDEPVARLPGLVITQRQFLAPLIEGHGLPVLLNVVQVELARQNAQRRGVDVTPDDLRLERERTLEQAFSASDDKLRQELDRAVAKGDQATAERLRQQMKQDWERGLEQLLAQQRVTRPEFELVLQTNAFLRKIAEKEMQPISDDVLQKAFETEYGATVRVRHIQATSVQEMARAQERLKAGEPFEKVARELSRNAHSGPAGGELPKFSLATTNMPQNFKEAAFNLKEGQVSDVVFCDGAYHLIKLEQKIAPKAVKFESVKESLRAKVREQVLQAAVTHLRDQLGEQTRTALKIEDPVLREQFARKMDARDQQIKDLEKIRQQQEREWRQRREAQPQRPGSGGGGAAPPVDPQRILPVPEPATKAHPPARTGQ